MSEEKAFRSQKAHGVEMLRRSDGGLTVPPSKVFQSLEEIDAAHIVFKHQKFARPCPTRPRHGFVDSRPVNSKEELRQVMRETLEADPDGEVMLMDAIDAHWSAVVTPTNISIGAGHDGATGGTSLSFPLGGEITYPFSRARFDKDCRIPADEVGYLELVYGTRSRHGSRGACDDLFAVQYRAGRGGKVGRRDVPADTVVKRVVNPLEEGIDALEWETRVLELAKEEGVVVHLPGQSLVSHFAIHARNARVPVITDTPPAVGDTLEATDETLKDEDIDLNALRSGLAVPIPTIMSGSLRNSERDRRSMYIVLFAAHNGLGLLETSEGAHLVGQAVSYAASMATMACLGEMRHNMARRRNGPRLGREQIFAEAGKNFKKSFARLRQAAKEFNEGQWRGGFGGPAWFRCAQATTVLVNSAIRFMRTPTPRGARQLVGALNNIVNLSHNTGHFLNKFIGGEHFDQACQNRLNWILRFALPAIWHDIHLAPTDSTPFNRRCIQKYKPAPSDWHGQVRVEYLKEDGTAALHFQVVQVDKKNFKSVRGAYLKKINPCDERTARYVFGLPHLCMSLANSGGGPKWVDPNAPATAYVPCAIIKGQVYVGGHRLISLRDLGAPIDPSEEESA